MLFSSYRLSLYTNYSYRDLYKSRRVLAWYHVMYLLLNGLRSRVAYTICVKLKEAALSLSLFHSQQFTNRSSEMIHNIIYLY